MNEKRIYLMTRLAIFEEHHKEQLTGVRTESDSSFSVYSGRLWHVSCRDTAAGYYKNRYMGIWKTGIISVCSLAMWISGVDI